MQPTDTPVMEHGVEPSLGHRPERAPEHRPEHVQIIIGCAVDYALDLEDLAQVSYSRGGHVQLPASYPYSPIDWWTDQVSELLSEQVLERRGGLINVVA